MKIRITFSAVVEVEDDVSRNDAFDFADSIAGRIAKVSGVVLEVYDVEPVEEY
jgi:hypothetical protein